MEAPAGHRVLHRLARLPDPLAWPPAAYTGGGRFDDPAGEFRVLYAAASRIVCCLELIAPFRRPAGTAEAELQAALRALRPPSTPPEPLAGIVPADWVRQRAFAELSVSAELPRLDLRSAEGLEAVRHGLRLAEFDLGDVLQRHRPATQRIARWAYEQGLQAVLYPSRFAADSECWAIFDSAAIVRGPVLPLSSDDVHLVEAARRFGLTVESAA
ncbi:MAG TPA: RES family NAD+ phosphorylase [Dehalococcoidia bacterium]|nr:RES family NAD+ phosphorylase [Dehalococcoidia bacterium]